EARFPPPHKREALARRLVRRHVWQLSPSTTCFSLAFLGRKLQILPSLLARSLLTSSKHAWQGLFARHGKGYLRGMARAIRAAWRGYLRGHGKGF
ncbi:MAG: hypothetical protein FWH55_13950, partial [Oscillospiraceae bacterium]|nr:hypothetical protein [Oscillospiraceae bacterium]